MLTRIVVFSLVFLLIVALDAGAQNLAFSENSRPDATGLSVDFAQFKSARQNIDRLEIYYKIYNSDLGFVKDGDQFRASYEITAYVTDNGGHQVTSASRERSFAIDDYGRTKSDRDYRVSQINFLLPPGKYKVELVLTDKNSGGKIRRSIKANLKKFSNSTPQISGIQFAQAVDSVLYDSLFIKGDKTVIPSVSRVYGGDENAVLLYYQEVYQGGEKRENVLIESQILDRNFDVVYRDTLTSKFTDAIIREIRQISLNGLKAGQYVLEITLKGRRERAVDIVKEPFSLRWTADALVRNDFDRAILQLKYIATSQEMDQFKKAGTLEERLRLWNDFWFRRDPTPGTPENEYKQDYYRRIEFANEHFGSLKKEGWLTDRGMVFITYGEPDQVEDYPFEVDQKAHQIWYYYHSDNVRRFIFVDEWNDGDYRLQFPYDGLYR